MRNILFVTSNSGKVASLANRLPKDQFEITQYKFDLPELQGNSAGEISLGKAKAAYDALKKPLIVQDSALHINSLGGFPGPYIKYIQETIGPEGLIKLLEGSDDRSCYFETALTYIDGIDSYKTFVHKSKPATIAKEVDQTDSAKAWGIVWKIYIPAWADKPLSSIPKEEIDKRETKTDDNSEFAQFASWIKNN
jgi:non-canonical purine NTP pyrophosphatase (RdgB/HAM1 family)